MHKRFAIPKIHFNKCHAVCGIRDEIRRILPAFCAYFACAVCAAIIGIVCAKRLGEEYVRLNPYYQLQFGEYAPWSNFFLQSCFALLVFALGYFGTFRKILIIPGFLGVFYYGYRFGLNCVGACNVHLATGLCSIFLYYLPMLCAILIGCSVVLLYQSKFWLRGKASQTCPELLRKSAIVSLCAWGACVCVIFLCTVLLPTIVKWILF